MLHILTNMKNWIDRRLGLEKSDQDVADIKKNAIDKVSAVTVTLKKQGELQNQVIKKTTTYYLGKAAGIIR